MKNKKFIDIKRIGTILIQAHLLKMEKVDIRSERENVWSQISRRLFFKKRMEFYMYVTVASVAASLLLFFVIDFYFTKEERPSLDQFVELATPPSFDVEDINVYLSPDEKVEIEDQMADVSYSAEGAVTINDQQHPMKKEAKPSEFVEQKGKQLQINDFNQLIVPKGKFTHLTLSDGSIIHVNSGTRVVYPRVFSSDIREIFVEGEIYIDVKRDEKTPFIVKTDACKIEVLGTSFNVNAYKDEERTEVVLLKGAIRLSDKQNNKMKLEPNQLALLQNDRIKEVRKVKATDYIAWKDGILLLKRESLSSMSKRLERFYGCTIEMTPAAGQLIIHGKIDLSQPLDKVIDYVAKTAPIEYEKDSSGKYIVKEKNN